MVMRTDHPDRTRRLWLSCLASALRTSLACAVIGFTTLYGPASLRRVVAFPAFSYVTAMLIISNAASLGEAVHSCWLAFSATVQGIGPAMLSLWVIRPDRLSNPSVALIVALSALVVALPESTHMLSKRIALGQIVIVYTTALNNASQTEPVMHPLRVATSTFVGAMACLLAVLLPCPELAHYKVRQMTEKYTESACQRLKLFLKALSEENKTTALAFTSQAMSSGVEGNKLLHGIKGLQASMQWEVVPIKLLRPRCRNPRARLQDVEVVLRGMELAVTSSAFSVGAQNQEHKDGLITAEQHIDKTVKQVHAYLLCTSTSFSPAEANEKNIVEFFQTRQTTLPTHKEDLPSFFFFFCLMLLHAKTRRKPPTFTKVSSSHHKIEKLLSYRENLFRWDWGSWLMEARRMKFIPAVRCALSLGTAVYFGLIYSKKNGIWAGLPVAITFASAREATFSVTNTKLQGTVLGTAYAVLVCFIFEKLFLLRFTMVLPWFIFTSFLQRSRMYGKAGAVSAVIGAILILGRKHFGPPKEFAVARIIETFIGLCCSVMFEVVLQPTRASTLAKTQLSSSLGPLTKCLESMNLRNLEKLDMEGHQEKLKSQVNELAKFIGQAEVEPNFWFLPFPSACYHRLLGSLSKMVDSMLFVASVLKSLEKDPNKGGAIWKEVVETKLGGDLELFKRQVGSKIRCLQNVTSVESLATLESRVVEGKRVAQDVELGKSSNTCPASEEDETAGMEKTVNLYLAHLKEVSKRVHDAGNNGEVELVLSLGALGFCLNGLVEETKKLEKGIKELLQWENPSAFIDLVEISCKLHALEN